MKEYKEFENFLEEEHMKNYHGSKDLALEAFNNWIQNLEIEDWLYYGESYGIKRALRAIDNVQEKLKKKE